MFDRLPRFAPASRQHAKIQPLSLSHGQGLAEGSAVSCSCRRLWWRKLQGWMTPRRGADQAVNTRCRTRCIYSRSQPTSRDASRDASIISPFSHICLSGFCHWQHLHFQVVDRALAPYLPARLGVRLKMLGAPRESSEVTSWEVTV